VIVANTFSHPLTISTETTIRMNDERQPFREHCKRIKENDPNLQTVYMGIEDYPKDDEEAIMLATSLSCNTHVTARLALMVRKIISPGARHLLETFLNSSESLQSLYLFHDARFNPGNLVYPMAYFVSTADTFVRAATKMCLSLPCRDFLFRGLL
jgi:hypothetical protein